MSSKTLLAYDGSSFSRIAEALLPKFQTVLHSEVVVAHSVYFPSPMVEMDGLGPQPVEAASILADLNKESKRLCEDSVARLKELGINARVEMLEGESAVELLQYAADHDTNLIAVGSRGMGAFAALILGSVARKLVTHSKSTVLVARAFQADDPDATVKRVHDKRKLDVVVGYDGSTGAKRAVTWLQTQGLDAFNSIAVVCVEPLSPLPAGLNPEGMQKHFGADHGEAEAIAKNGASDLNGISKEVVPLTKFGRASDQVNAVARDRNADLIVVAAQGHGAVERFLIGSVSYEVATSAPCSVLIVR